MCSLGTALQRTYTFARTIADGFEFRWSVVNDTVLSVGLAAPTTGWLALGLAESSSGAMGGSDVVQVHTDNLDNFWSVRDGFVMRTRAVRPDARQDWTLVAASTADGVQTVELDRRLATGDPNAEDRDLGARDAAFGTRVNFAYSGSAAFGTAHGSGTAFRTAINLFTGTSALELAAEDAQAREYAVDNTITGPGGDDGAGTTYTHTCFDLGVAEDEHAVAFVPTVDNSEYVRHIHVYGFRQTSTCGGDSGGGDSSHVLGSRLLLFTWQAGGDTEAFVLPSNAGIPLAAVGSDWAHAYASVVVQVQ